MTPAPINEATRIFPSRFAAAPLKAPPRPRTMNKLERAYADQLDARRLLGEVAAYWPQAVTLVLAEGVRYTPDFMVQLADGTLELHETKGFMRDDARVKLRVCARTYPFRVRLVRRQTSAWIIEEVAP